LTARPRTNSVRKEQRPKLLDLIETTTKDIGTTLGLIDDSIPAVGSRAFEKLKVSKLMVEDDCISMRNEPIDRLETIEDMQFDLGLSNADDRPHGNTEKRKKALYESRKGRKEKSQGGYMDKMEKIFT
jgi:hypothetical protein